MHQSRMRALQVFKKQEKKKKNKTNKTAAVENFLRELYHCFTIMKTAFRKKNRSDSLVAACSIKYY